MKLRVKNLGPIKQGEIDLSKRFFVFVGYNNTGKTYMAQVLWSVLEFFGEYAEERENKQTIYEIPILSVGEEYIIEGYFQDRIKYFQDKLKQKILNDLNNESLRLLFDLDLSEFINDFKSIEYRFIYGEVNRHFIVNKLKDSLSISIKRISKIELDNDYEDVYPHYYDEGITDPLDKVFIKPLVDILNPKQFFLPASRSFYTTFYNYVFLASKMRQDSLQKMLRNNKNLF